MYIQRGRSSAVRLVPHSRGGPGVWMGDTETKAEWQSQGKSGKKTLMTR